MGESNVKNWRFVVGLLAGVVAVLLISVIGATSAGTRDYDLSIMASWVQAVGAVAAIIWSGKFAADQMRAQRRLQDEATRNGFAQRLETFVAVCEVACEEVSALERSLTREDHHPDDVARGLDSVDALLQYAFVIYEERTFQGLSSALGAFPIHELPNAQSVSAAQRFRDGFMHASKAVAAWVDTMRAVSRPPFKEAEYVVEAATYIRGQLGILKYCLEQLRRVA